ncbi:MAG: hypothetical protein JWO57_1153 [Pseudonocardiales bacterium]|nr:hypothetical protein [Pseudonocardiales bacterium]
MWIPAASSTALRDVLAGPVAPARWLGASASALYVSVDHSSVSAEGPSVVAVVSHDAVRLPCALVLPATAAERPLSALTPMGSRHSVRVGAGRVEWDGPGGSVTVAAVREWRPACVASGEPRAERVEALRTAIKDIGIAYALVDTLVRAGDSRAQAGAVADLLGRGPGLTPSGDDVVAGFLLGARAFGRSVPGAVRAVEERATTATTALSAELLRYATRGECVPEVATAAAAMTGRRVADDALAALLAVGHTSGSALAAGLVAAADVGSLVAVGAA